ncbi:hypothetical protein [Amphritea japonica]|uniref:Rap1a immunity protein domain-containing protein n=1 Tax=Amphritea japonica ATCC BAA-1530 TaxID=1278309 RepID=A0A7R6PAD1_9GAMM|nr:hypothetical protein [Amphritea japonica]BBB25808.1 conserved hypothetical protein [Amphritea japonica ATCC BAA-1530]
MQGIKQVLVIASLIFTTVSMADTADENQVYSKQYILGFLAGAQLTDSEIIRRMQVESNIEPRSDFFKRAFKTRVGKSADSVPATYYAGFCIPEDESSESIVTHIQEQIGLQKQTNKTDIALVIYKAIQTRYPC